MIRECEQGRESLLVIAKLKGSPFRPSRDGGFDQPVIHGNYLVAVLYRSRVDFGEVYPPESSVLLEYDDGLVYDIGLKDNVLVLRRFEKDFTQLEGEWRIYGFDVPFVLPVALGPQER